MSGRSAKFLQCFIAAVPPWSTQILDEQATQQNTMVANHTALEWLSTMASTNSRTRESHHPPTLPSLPLTWSALLPGCWWRFSHRGAFATSSALGPELRRASAACTSCSNSDCSCCTRLAPVLAGFRENMRRKPSSPQVTKSPPVLRQKKMALTVSTQQRR